jgi:hypothetical protein
MKGVFLMGATTLALTLGACDAGPSAASRSPAALGAPPSAGAPTPATAPGTMAATDPRDAPVPLATDGKPMWAANRKHTAEENAVYQFGKNGKDFAALSEADYVRMAHAFIDAPPAGVQQVQRSNGDDVLYDAKSNTFVVATSAGAPRTMFKPRDGAAYWRQQIDHENGRSSGGDDSSQG